MYRASGRLRVLALTSCARLAHCLRTSRVSLKNRSRSSRSPTVYYFVFDRRAHAIYMVDPERTTARKVVDIGQEAGRIIQPGGFDAAAEGSFVVADVPRGQERIQIFGPGALRTGGFFLAGRSMPQVTLGNYALSGISSMQFTSGSLLVSEPERGSLITEYSASGTAISGRRSPSRHRV